LSLIENTLPETTTNEEKVDWKVDDVKERKTTIYSVRDHTIPCISTLKTSYEMYDALKKMFKRNNTNRALTLNHQLQNIKMTKYDTIATFLMRNLEIRDQLGSIGENVIDGELVITNLNALPRHWEPFLQSVSGRVDLPEFDRLWTDCTWEDTRLISRGVQDSHDDENKAPSSHAKRGRGNRRIFDKVFKDKKNLAASRHEHRKDI
jgi:hypothetical protein